MKLNAFDGSLIEQLKCRQSSWSLIKTFIARRCYLRLIRFYCSSDLQFSIIIAHRSSSSIVSDISLFDAQKICKKVFQSTQAANWLHSFNLIHVTTSKTFSFVKVLIFHEKLKIFNIRWRRNRQLVHFSTWRFTCHSSVGSKFLDSLRPQKSSSPFRVEMFLWVGNFICIRNIVEGSRVECFAELEKRK